MPIAPATLFVIALVVFAGLWVGHRVNVRAAPSTVARVIGAVLFVPGASLIARSV